MVMTVRIVAFLAISFSFLVADTYYVSPSGNDNNPGTMGSPLLTIQAGINKAYSGDIVMVLAGTYKEQVTFPRSGDVGSVITLRGEVDGASTPLAVIDPSDTLPTGDWLDAPEVGAGVFKRSGFTPGQMFLDGDQMWSINSAHMEGDSDAYCDKGFNILNYDTNKVWHPYTPSCSTAFWPDVQAVWGTIGDTTYIRYVDRDWDPDTCDFRYSTAAYVFSLTNKDYITLEYLQIQGADVGVSLVTSDHNNIRYCVLSDGSKRISVSGSYNRLSHNYMTTGYGSYVRFGEWGDYTPAANRRCAAYALGKWMDSDGASRDDGVGINGENNTVDSNTIRRGAMGFSFGSSCSSYVFGNQIDSMSSVGFYLGIPVKQIFIYDNDIEHCNIHIRLGSVCDPSDTVRSGFIYNNRCYNNDHQGEVLKFHGGGYDYTNPPNFWMYHNSFAGLAAWGVPYIGYCKNFKVVNNIMSVQEVANSTSPTTDAEPEVFPAFDYNFLGGKYKGYRYQAWMFRDRHSQWAADTMAGDINHQVWPLGSEPDWIVPDTSTAYQSGLDLSDSFTLRGVKYGPLPGMEPGYFPEAKPNLGAVQHAGHLGTPQRDPGRGSVTQRPELAFAPNPATGRDVMVRCAIPTGQVGKLTLRDVVGRTVKSVALGRSGNTQLDLRGFAPGVYVAKLETTGPPVSRKLIITAH